ncbi:hypothetical protein O6H91_Y398100 [Diphasiastrum complanatum]|nr:hypothetical protein O6H91_Y398100 [Diphasiastrum complanatum]
MATVAFISSPLRSSMAPMPASNNINNDLCSCSSTSASFRINSCRFFGLGISSSGALYGTRPAMRASLRRPSRVTRSILEQGAEESGPPTEAELTTESATVPNPLSAYPEMPPEWREKEDIRLAELAAKIGVSIRRRPPTGPPNHYVGPFQFRIQSEGNTPRNILEEIIWHKDTEVSQMKEKMPLQKVTKALETAPPARDFIGALRVRAAETGLPGLIAEVKKASPSRGVLQPDFDPVKIAKAYELGGAACLSVLTDSKYFQGSFENLALIREAGVQCPLLCKEFFIDAWQIYYARSKGADAILLIAAVLPDQDLRYMSKIAKSLGMAALIEVHNRREMDRVLGISGAKFIGINNRNLETFEVDINNTVALLQSETVRTVQERNILVSFEHALVTNLMSEI